MFQINNNAPFPFQGVFPDNAGDMAPLRDILRFKVAREAEWLAPGWEAAGGESGDAADRRAVVDAALALQMAPHGGFPPHFKMDEASAALEASYAPLLPAWSSPPRAHPGPAPAAFADAQNALSRTLPECPRSAAAANAVDELHPELCLRSLVFIEQLACPATMPGDPGRSAARPAHVRRRAQHRRQLPDQVRGQMRCSRAAAPAAGHGGGEARRVGRGDGDHADAGADGL